MKKGLNTMMAALMLLLLSFNAMAQTPPTITGTVSTTSAICSGTGSITINTATGAAAYNLVNSDLSSLPVGASVGGVNYTPAFTSGNPHYLQLTPATNSTYGFITFAETTLKPVNFIATFGLYVGNGTGADGTSFNYGKVNTSSGNYGEAGMIDSGLAIGFNDYSNKIIIYYNKVQLTSFNVNGTLNNSGWKSVSIEVTGSGQLTLSYGGGVYCTNYQLPAAYVSDNKTNWKYGFAARCGGLNNLHAVNDVVIKDRTPWEYSVENNYYFTGNIFSSLFPGNYDVYARIGDAAYNSHGYNTTTHLGPQTITGLSVAATLTPTNPTTCTGTGTIAISNVTHNFVPYDLIYLPLTNNQLGGASVGGLGSSFSPYWGNGDLVLTSPNNSISGYIDFGNIIAQPNAFTANFDMFIGGGAGADGMSFNYGNLNTSGGAGAAESGMVNSGLAIGFSEISNTIKIFYNKNMVQSYTVNGLQNNGYKSVSLSVTQSGQLTLVYGGTTICTNYQLPAAYLTDNKSSWHYAMAARCGGLNNYHSIKNVVIKDNDIQYFANNGGQTWTSATTFTGLATGNHTIIARQSNGVHCLNTFQIGTATITYTPDITATVASTSQTTCTSTGGTISISNVSHGQSSPYDLVNISLTNSQLGNSTIGNLGTSGNPYWGGTPDLVLTSATSSTAGYIAFGNTVAQPNAFAATYDMIATGGNGGDGLSFNYGNLNTSGSLGGAESGIVNSGLAIGFSEYANTIKIFYNKTELQSYSANLRTGAYKSVAITVTYDGQVTIVYGGTTICSNYQLPAAYATDNKSSWHYALAARCGASNNYHSVKNVVIKDNSIQYTINGQYYTEDPHFTSVYPDTYNVRARISNGSYCSILSSLGSVTITPPPGMVAITGQPSTTNQSVAQNATATTLSVTATGAGTVSYQWYSNTTATNNGGNPIVGATSASYTPPTSAVGTKYYYCLLSNACSEVISAVSGSVTVRLCTPTTSSQTTNICVSAFPYSWNGLTFTAAGTQTAHLTNAAGCDSAASLTVTTTSPAPNAFNYDRYGDPSYELVKGQSYNQQPILPENIFGIAYGYAANGVAVDTAGNVFVSDGDNDVIKKIDKNGNETTFYSNGIKEPGGLATDKAGNVYVTNVYYNKVLKISKSGSLLNTYTGFNQPLSVAVDTAGNIYVADQYNNKVKKISTNGTITVIGSGFVEPAAIALDATGNIYVGDFSGTGFSGRVKKMTTNGTISVLATGFDDMYSIAVDANNNVYVADGGNSNGVIKVIAPNGTISTIGSGLAAPIGVALDTKGNVYVADIGNSQVYKITTGGGAVSNYSISPSLPAGLIFDTLTGVITGTPTVVSAATDYTVTAHNCGGTATAIVNLTIISSCTPTTSNNSIAICPSALPYSWNGLTFNAAGTQTKTGLTNAGGCDSSATLTVTVKAVTSSSNSIAICSSALPYSWNGLTFNAAGTQTKTGLTNAAGCDSSATLTVTVKAVTSSSSSIAICPSALPYSWNGLTFNAAGTQTKTGLTNAAGCDSSATLTITVKAVTSSNNSIAICPSALPYSWNGLTFNAAGTQTKTGLTNAAGCDSSASLTVTVKAVTSSSNSIAICPSALPYSWNGLTFNAAGTQTKTGLTNAAGCDSSATLTVTVKTNYTITATPKGNGTISNSGVSTICEGDNTAAYIIVANSGYSIAGVWVDGINQGAISTYTFNNVTAHHTIVAIFVSNCLPTTSTTNATVCANALPYSWNSNSYNAAGSYIVHFTNAKGCDSAATLNLTVTNNPSSGQLYSKYGYTNNITLCTLESFSVYPDVKGGVWSSADSNIVSTIKQPGSTSSIVFKPQNAGTVKVNYITSNTGVGACPNVSSILVIVAPQALPAAISGASKVCVGATANYTTASTGGVWSVASRATINASGVATGTSAGNTAIVYTVTNAAGCSASSSLNVTINALPAIPTFGIVPGTPSITGSGGYCKNKTFNVVGNPAGGTWSSSGSFAITNLGVVTTAATPGVGSVSYAITNANGCTSSRTISANVVTCSSKGINNQMAVSNEQLVVYPNPAHSTINLNVRTLVGRGSIVVTDLYGKQLKTQTLSMGTNTIDVSSFAKGMYMVSVITETGKQTQKVVVE